MSGKVLYRKYRPTKLTDVIGQEQVTDALENALKQGKIGHAYLFVGPRGTGKTSVARIFAHAVDGFKYQVEDSYLDIIEIDAASNTGVDNIRELREKAIIAPTQGKYKVYIIDEVHMLTKSASNALLKTLEEPPEHVIFILATTDAHKVPITISSRTQVFTFKLADADVMFHHLQSIAQKEKIPINDDALRLVVRRGGGSFRDSLSLLDQISTLASGEITIDFLSQALGLPQDQLLQDLLQAYSQADKSTVNILLKDLLNQGIKPEIIASELIEHIIADPQDTYLSLLAQLPNVQPPFPEAKLLLSLLNFKPSSPQSNAIAPAAQPDNPNKTEQTTKNLPQPAPYLASTPTESEQNRTEPPTASSDKSTTQTAQPNDFNWDTFLENIHADSDGLFQQLQKVDHDLTDGILHIYPLNKFNKGILEKPAHQQLLTKHLGGIALELHDLGTKQPPKDETLSQISAIMGDIKEVTGDSPF